MSERNPNPEASIEHLDWQPEAAGLVQPELPADELLRLVNNLMHRVDAGESREMVLSEHGNWDALERSIGSKYMKEIFGNRKENE